MNVVTKSGTNQFHGNVYEYFRNTVLNAQGFLNTVKPQFNQNQFGGTLGGPVKKDRTFFFASYEGRRVRQGVSGPLGTRFRTSGRDQRKFRTVRLPSGTRSAQGGINDQFVADVLNGRTGGPSAITGAGGVAPVARASTGAPYFPTAIFPVPAWIRSQ